METQWEFRRILVAFDGSEDSKRAVKAACALAKRLESSVILLHVFSVPVYAYGGPAGVPAISVESLEGTAKRQATTMVESGLELARSEGIEAKGELVESGAIAEAIVSFATKQGIQLIVLGTRGMSGLKKVLMGSVSSGVVNHSLCPVLVVR